MVVPVCAPVFASMMSAQQVSTVFNQMRLALSPNQTGGDLIIDNQATDAEIAEWTACVDANETGCKANATLVETLCQEISLNAPNPKLEGSVRGLKFAKEAADLLKDGKINTTSSAPNATRRRVLAATADAEVVTDRVAVSDGGANLTVGGAFDSGDAADADLSNAVDNSTTSNNTNSSSARITSVYLFALISSFLALSFTQ